MGLGIFGRLEGNSGDIDDERGKRNSANIDGDEILKNTAQRRYGCEILGEIQGGLAYLVRPSEWAAAAVQYVQSTTCLSWECPDARVELR